VKYVNNPKEVATTINCEGTCFFVNTSSICPTNVSRVPVSIIGRTAIPVAEEVTQEPRRLEAHVHSRAAEKVHVHCSIANCKRKHIETMMRYGASRNAGKSLGRGRVPAIVGI